MCSECGFDWASPANDVMATISTFGDAYRNALINLQTPGTANESLAVRPTPEIWSAIEYLCHVRDALDFYIDRIDHVVTTDRPALLPKDFDSLCETGIYRSEDASCVLDAILELIAKSVAQLTDLKDRDWNRVGIGSSGDERTVLVLARRVAHEGRHHLLDLDRFRHGVNATV